MAAADSLSYEPTRTSETNPWNEEEEGKPPSAKRWNEEGGRQSAAKKSKANANAANVETDVSVPMEKEEEEEEDEDYDVWESESFAEWSDLNWSLFDYDFNDSSDSLPSDIFEEEIYHHAGKTGILKPGYRFMLSVDSDLPHIEGFLELGKRAAALAIDFYNEQNKEGGKQLQFEKMVSYINYCTYGRFELIFFISFEAADEKGEKKIFQACVIVDDASEIRALREKPR